MKNTMKMKSLLSFFVPAAMMSLMVAGCSDYDNGYDSNAIKFNEEFRKAYGDIDPEQDWNLAERGTVTVSTMKESEVKIYALRGNEYVLVGDYEGVKGTKMLGFDMVEGTTSIMVTDGVTAEKTVPGGVVTFGGTRTTYPGNDVVKIDKIENENGLYLETTGKTYQKYVEFKSMDDYSKIFETVPEIGWNVSRDKTNLNKVPSNFHYKSNGSFIIYPIFWNTSSLNTLGVYYKNGNEIVKVPVYKHKEGNEVQYVGNLRKDADWSNHYETNGHFDTKDKILSWTTSNYNQVGNLGFDGNLISQGYKYLTINAEMLGSTTQYRIYFRDKNDDSNQNIFPVDQSGSYTIKLSDVSNDIVTNCTILISGGGNSETGSVKVNSMYLWSDDVALHNFEGTDEAHFRCDAIFEQGVGKFNGQKILAQGIKVDIPEGTVFGMYLEKTENAGTENAKTYTFYSESELNDPGEVGYGVIDDGNGHVTEVTDPNNPKSHPCYASAFDVDGLHYLGFEDWPNAPYNNSDFDLNDMLFAFDGCKPTIINEEPDKWLLACEDLGSSFDTDYNDVVFKVEHVSGREYANVTAMAAGGTLASYIVLNNGSNPQVVGEIHQMLGAASEKSGEYTPINANSRKEAVGSVVTIDVPANFTMTYSTEVNSGSVNMGGFEIRTLNSGEEPAPVNVTVNDLSNSQTSVIAAPDKGSAPYMLCLPYTYTKDENGKRNTYVWAWPQELCTICSATYSNGKYSGSNGGAYLDFGAWVSSYSDNRDWYKNPNPAGALIVEPLLLKSEDIQQGGGTNVGTETPPLGTQGYANNQYLWGDGDNHEYTIYSGEELKIQPYINDGRATNPITMSFNAGGTGSTYVASSTTDLKNGNVVIKGGPTKGTATLTLHYPGDALYSAKDVTITVKVLERLVSRLTFESGGKTYALTHVNTGNNHEIQMKELNNNDDNQVWYLQERDNWNNMVMYNKGAQMYLIIKSSSYTEYNASFQTGNTSGSQNGRFRFESIDGYYGIICRQKDKQIEKNLLEDPTKIYFGSDGIGDGNKIFLDKAAGAGRILWTLTPVAQ